jgi:hypothetical protein
MAHKRNHVSNIEHQFHVLESMSTSDWLADSSDFTGEAEKHSLTYASGSTVAHSYRTRSAARSCVDACSCQELFAGFRERRVQLEHA